MASSFPPTPSTPTPCLPHPLHPNSSSQPLPLLPSPATPNPFLGLNYTISEEDLQRGRIISGLAVLRLCLSVFGCVANAMAGVVLTNRKLWSPTSMLLLSLVIYDACYLLLGIPVGATSISVNLNFTPAGYSTLRTMMALCFPLRCMAQMGSTYTTLTVTLERFLVILLPLRASSMWTYGKTRRAIVGLLLFSVLFNLPRCFDHILSKPRAAPRALPVDSVSLNGNASSGVNVSSLVSLSRFGEVMDGREREGYSGMASPWSDSGSNVSGSGSNVSRSGSVSCLNGSRGVTSGSWKGQGNVNLTQSLGKSSTGSGPTFSPTSGDDSEGVSEDVVYFYMVVYQFYLTIIFLYLIPYTLIPVLNFQLVIALRRRRDESRRLSVKNEHRLNWTRCRLTVASKAEKEDGLTYIVFGITLCYFICCILPFAYFVSAIATDFVTNPTGILLFNAGETTLVINAATDFFFYCLLGRKFRRVFMRMFCARRYIHKANSFSMRTTISYNSV